MESPEIPGVGTLYMEGRTKWDPHSAVHFARAHELVILIEKPTERELREIDGPWRFDLYKQGTALFFTYRLGSLIGVTNFNINMVPEERREIPDGSDTTLSIIVVDASNGIVVKTRRIVVAKRMAQTIAKAIQDQVPVPFNMGDHVKLVNEVRRAHGYRALVRMGFAYFRGS